MGSHLNLNIKEEGDVEALQNAMDDLFYDVSIVEDLTGSAFGGGGAQIGGNPQRQGSLTLPPTLDDDFWRVEQFLLKADNDEPQATGPAFGGAAGVGAALIPPRTLNVDGVLKDLSHSVKDGSANRAAGLTQSQHTVGDMTVEQFLVKAGVAREGGAGAQVGGNPQRHGSLILPQVLNQKMGVNEKSEGVTDGNVNGEGEVTLEEFLLRAGVAREDGQAVGSIPKNNLFKVTDKVREALVEDNFELAVELYNQIMRMEPYNPHVYADRAQANIKLANFDEAVADANKAIQLDPSVAKSYLRKGTALLKLEEFQTAKETFEVGASLAPGDTRFSKLISECVQGIAEIAEGGRLIYSSLISDFSEKAQVKKEKKEEKLDGDASLNKQIYQDTDGDGLRAMSNSFVEPNGAAFIGEVSQWSNASLYSVEMLMLELIYEKARRYSYDELAMFTSNFKDEIGSGAFGNVYKGQFSNGVEVAVKVLKRHEFIHHSFLTEIKTMGKTDHQNLIKLIGFCLEENMLAVVYEYMKNGSLDMILYKKPLTIEWDKLYAIAVEIANGLAYLHHDCEDQIIHHDIKASNVLLDSSHLPKLSDFGLANLKDVERTHLTLTKCRGTPGYAAPEIWTPFSPITCKCDVYSFGMILFEILGTERNNRTDIWFPCHVWQKFNSGTLDDLLMECGISEKDRGKAKILSLVALWCAQFTPQTRPSMSTVVTVLKNKILVTSPPNPFLPSESSEPMQPV